MQYAVCRFGDGAAFVILLRLKDAMDNPLQEVAEYPGIPCHHEVLARGANDYEAVGRRRVAQPVLIDGKVG
jgi:hypothetical protein